MNSDWTSDESQLLINPRMPNAAETRELFTKADLPGHLFIATSGSTSPKWCALSKRAILASAAAVNGYLQANEGDVWIHPLPDFHVGGIGIRARAYLTGSKVVVLEGRWDPLQFCVVVNKERGTLSSLVPTQLYDLVKNECSAPPTLRALFIGGGALSDELFTSAASLGWPCVPTYGMTEAASQVATAGKLLPHVEVRLSPEKTLEVRGPSLFTCYVAIQENRVLFSDPKVDGYFTTEDLVELFPGGGIKVLGRRGDLFKIGGEMVSFPALLALFERLKQEYRIEEDLVLIPVPDERLDRVIHVATTAKTPAVHTLIDAFNERVLPYERVRKIHCVDAIPRSSLYKVLYNELLSKLVN